VASDRVRHQRREAKAARRRNRLAKGGAMRRAFRRAALAREGQGIFERELMAPIRKQSKPRQKALDAEAKSRRKARAKGWKATA